MGARACCYSFSKYLLSVRHVTRDTLGTGSQERTLLQLTRDWVLDIKSQTPGRKPRSPVIFAAFTADTAGLFLGL